MSENPFKQADGSPIEGMLKEFSDWEIDQSQKQLKALPLSERMVIIERKLRIAHRMQSEVTDTPDFETWRKEAIIHLKDLLEP